MARGNVTLEDIASKTGISSSSVWKAINNKPDVSEFTRKRVLEAAESLQYANIRRKGTLSRQGLKRVGLVYYERRRPVDLTGVYSRLISGIQQEVHDHLGGEVLIESVDGDRPGICRHWLFAGPYLQP